MMPILPKTKIVCTLGPATSSEEVMRKMILNGMSVARLNLSHGTFGDHSESVVLIRSVSNDMQVPISIMVDVPGDKYRTGPIDTGVLNLEPRDKIALTSRDILGNSGVVSVSPPGIHEDVVVGGKVFLDDGRIELCIDGLEGQDLLCEVSQGGRLTEGRGVVIPGRSVSNPFPDEKAMAAIGFAAQHEVDFVALSMVESVSHIQKARRILGELGVEPQLISKIERLEGLNNFDDILLASDAVMIARGDMGVEVRLAEVPMIQKDIIRKCNLAGKPVITATQMLESMVISSVPTRAEVTDVANAVYDGTDAVMLSGETSVGAYPAEAVKVMSDVSLEAEKSLPYERMIVDKRTQLQNQTDDAISYDACQTAYQLNASLIVAFTESGGTAGRVSKYRPMPRILALTPSVRIQRRLTLRWGVTPVVTARISTVDDFFQLGVEEAEKLVEVVSGSIVILVAGLPIGVSGGTNLLRVLKMD